MTYTVAKLITNAYYTSGIVARSFQTVQGDQLEDGLDFLNEILGDKTVENDMIPYMSKYTFNSIVGQESYFVPNLIQTETVVFFLDTVRYQMVEIPRKAYFGSTRAQTIQTLPLTYHIERQFNGANIYLYFLPNQVYPMEVWGQFRLQAVDFNQDLSSNFANADLGQVSITGAGTLVPGQLVINGVDMAGNYATAAALNLAINAISISVKSNLFTNDLQLFGQVAINIVTNGQGTIGNTITFANFSTVSGPLSPTYFPMGLDQFYITYLKYALAVRLCTEFAFDIPVGVQKQLIQYEQMISKRSQQMDLRMRKVSTLGSPTGLNYAIINFGGWTV